MLARRGERGQDDIELDPIVDAPTLVAMQRAIEDVYVSESVGLYMVDVVAATRDSARTEVGASPRGSLALYKLPAAGPCCAAATTSCPTTSRRSPAPRSATGSRSSPSCGCAACGPRRSWPRSSRPSPTPAAEDRVARRRMTRSASARLGGYAAFASAMFLRGAASRGGRPWPRSARRSQRSSCSRSRSRGRPTSPWRSRSRRSRTVEGEQVEAALELTSAGALHEVELALAASVRHRARRRLASGWSCASRPASGASCRSSSCPGAGAPSGSARSPVRVRDRFGLVAYDAVVEADVTLRAYPRPERLRSLVDPLETQPFAGNRRRARPRRGHRVRRPAPVRRRRPRPARQLARERPPRRAVRERAAPGAEQRRRALPRQLRRGAAASARARSTSPSARRRRCRTSTSSGATASASSASAASCSGCCRRPAGRRTTGSPTR